MILVARPWRELLEGIPLAIQSRVRARKELKNLDMLGGLYSKLAAIDGTLNSLRGHRG